MSQESLVDIASEARVGVPPVFDAECNTELEKSRDELPIAVTIDMLADFRQMNESANASDEILSAGGTYAITERVIPGPVGDPDIALLISIPTAATSPVPVIYNIHGGGMIGGTPRSALHVTADIAAANNCALVSVDYRLAPEHPHPAPVEDCYAGLCYVVDHADELGIDPARVIIFGISAGGGLAAATTLLARDRGGPALHGQMLLAPMLDDRNHTPSAVQMAGRGVWDRTANETGWTALLGANRGGPDVSPYASASRAESLADLPATFIDAGSAETFRDEAVDYAQRIWHAGGDAELHIWPGGFHGYDVFAPEAAVSQATLSARMRWLGRLLRR